MQRIKEPASKFVSILLFNYASQWQYAGVKTTPVRGPEPPPLRNPQTLNRFDGVSQPDNKHCVKEDYFLVQTCS